MTAMGSYFSCTICFFPQIWFLLHLCTCHQAVIVGGKYSILFLTCEISAPAHHMKPRMRVTEGFYFGFFNHSLNHSE